MAKQKDSGRKPKITKVQSPLADPAEQKRFGISGVVNSNELNRIKDAQKLRKDTLAAGDTYYSQYDASLGNTEQSGYDAGKNDNIVKPSGGSGRNVLNDYTRQLQALLTGGSYADPYNSLIDKLSGLYGTAQTDLTTNKDTALTNLKSMYDTQGTNLARINTEAGTAINTSMDNLSASLKAQANPYADLQAETINPTAQLSSFLNAQNVGDQQAQDYAQVLNAQNAGSAGAFNNLANVMRSISGANQQGAIADVETQRNASTGQRINQNAAYQAQLSQGLFADQGKINSGYSQNKFDLSKGLLSEQSGAEQAATGQQNDLIKMLMTAISKGGKPKKGKLF